MHSTAERRLRPGDIVEVRSAAEILGTLDELAALDEVPFMPEMLGFVGQRFTVTRRVEKICDTIEQTGSRRMRDTVLLDDLRCDGSAHGGCQAGCRIYWKEAWLRPLEKRSPAVSVNDAGDGSATLKAVSHTPTVVANDSDDEPARYRCQATQAFAATSPLSLWDPAQYVREVTSGNVGPGRFVRVLVRAVFSKVGHKLGFISLLPVTPGGETRARSEALNLQPGEWVKVRSADEIAGTLDSDGRNRGLWFDFEMLPYCGGTYQVKARVQRIIDDRTGKMLEFKNECIVLEGVVCSGERSTRRWFCPRAIYPYWREEWLRRVSPPAEVGPRPAPVEAQPASG